MDAMACESEEERVAITSFLSIVNRWRSDRHLCPIDSTEAAKFVRARKLNVNRSLQLYQQHQLMRVREALDPIHVLDEELRKELESGKFTVLPSTINSMPTLALFNAWLHDPSGVSHRDTLRGVVYQLDACLQTRPITQTSGLIFIYNMNGSKYSNFDYELSQKMLTLLKGAYPARLKKVLVVTAPLWFKAPFKVLRLFLREKLRDRVYTVTLPQLQSHVPINALPVELGGTLVVDHQQWLQTCQRAFDNRKMNKIENSNGGSENSIQQYYYNLSIDQLATMPTSTNEGNLLNGEKLSTHSSMSSEVSLSQNHHNNNDDENEDNDEDMDNNPEAKDFGMTLDEFIDHVRTKGRRGLYEEYAEIKNRPPSGTFHVARSFENQLKNRYSDVLCYDHSRVSLNTLEEDYINANFVDGYKQPRAFISTQGPVPKTFEHFWAMVWEQQTLVIVMTTRTVERQRSKCGQYWPEDAGLSLTFGPYEVTCDEIETFGPESDFVLSKLQLRNTTSGETRRVSHFQFVAWPDYGVPDSALSMLHFLRRVRAKQSEMLSSELSNWSGHRLGPAIVVHCSAGIGRTGTFATLDIAINRFEDVKRVDIQSIVEGIRAQRAFSIQMPDQYVFCHLAFLEYAIDAGHVEQIDLKGFDDDCDSD